MQPPNRTQSYFEHPFQSCGVIEFIWEFDVLDRDTVLAENICSVLHGLDGAGPGR